MSFHPTPETEKGQVKIFAGSETLETRFDAAFIRLNPDDFESALAASQLQPKVADPREFRRARGGVSRRLAEVVRDRPRRSEPRPVVAAARSGDFLAEIHTRRFDTLTYAKSASEAEDITVFDRKRHHNISLYPSKRKLANRGRFYNEDELVDYDILDYDIDVAITPDRQWIDGRVRHAPQGAGARPRQHYDAARRIAGRPVDRQLRARPPVRHPGQEPEHDRRQSADDAAAGRRADADRHLRGPARAADAGSRNAGADAGTRQDRDCRRSPRSRASCTATAATGIRRRRSATTRPRRIRISVPTTLDCVASGELEPGFPTRGQLRSRRAAD